MAMFHVEPDSRVLQFASPSFDASVFEIVMALGLGGALQLLPKAPSLGGDALSSFFASRPITHATLTPAVLASLPPDATGNGPETLIIAR